MPRYAPRYLIIATTFLSFHALAAGVRAEPSNAEALQAFEQRLAGIMDDHTPKLKRAAAKAAEAGSDFQSSFGIIAYLAWDQMNSTDEATGYLKGRLNPTLKSAKDALARDIDQAWNDLIRQLRENTLSVAVASADDEHADAWEQVDGEMSDEQFKQALTALGYDVAWRAADYAAEIAENQSSWGSVRVAGALWGSARAVATRSFGRQVISKMVGSLVAAGIDGPSLLGDIIGLAGLTSVTWDIYYTMDEFRQNLDASVTDSLLAVRDEMHAKALDQARSVTAAYDALQRSIDPPLLSVGGVSIGGGPSIVGVTSAVVALVIVMAVVFVLIQRQKRKQVAMRYVPREIGF